MHKKIQTLIVDDEALIRDLIKRELNRNCEITMASNSKDALKEIQNNTYDLALIDLNLGEIGNKHAGLKLIEAAAEKDIYVIVLSGETNQEINEKAEDLGAARIFSKKLHKDITQTIRELNKEVVEFLLERNNFLQKNIFNENYMSSDPDLINSLQNIISYLDSGLPIFINGATGTGKTELARRLHQLSKLKGDFIEINCAQLSSELIESELFGHKKGSFTGATESKKGKLALANEGTLFLDEIGRLPLKTQGMPLKAIEEKKFYPLGSDRAEHSNFRVISATSQELEKLVYTDHFLNDLYQRISGKKIFIKPLSQRPKDIENITRQFLKNEDLNISSDALKALIDHKWPGNIRELKTTLVKIKSALAALNTKKIGLQTVKKILKDQTTSNAPMVNIEQLFEACCENGCMNTLRDLRTQIMKYALNEKGLTPNMAVKQLKLGKGFISEFNDLKGQI
jgi:DNA-binding NtrC family response regulator